MDVAKVQKMADMVKTLMGMTTDPQQCADELFGILSRDSNWTAQELLELRAIVIPTQADE